MSDYRVQLEVYNGPLDLLLYLIRRDEIDVYDIPIARVTGQYIAYCETLKLIDPNLVGDFLVMAATLMEIKSRLLLPRPPAVVDDGEDLFDPRSELVKQLLEYKQFKDASMSLSEAAEAQIRRWSRGAPERPRQPGSDVDLEDIHIWDLVNAFGRILEATGRGPVTHDVIVDDTPITLHAVDIIDRLQREGGIPFQRLFIGRRRGEMIGLFLALLELIREKRVRARQDLAFGEIVLDLLSAEPIEIGDDYTGMATAEDEPDARDDGDDNREGDNSASTRVTADDDETFNDEEDEVDPEDASFAAELDSLKIDLDDERVDERADERVGDSVASATGELTDDDNETLEIES